MVLGHSQKHQSLSLNNLINYFYQAETKTTSYFTITIAINFSLSLKQIHSCIKVYFNSYKTSDFFLFLLL